MAGSKVYGFPLTGQVLTDITSGTVDATTDITLRGTTGGFVRKL